MIHVCIVTTSFPRWQSDYRGTFIWEAAQALKAKVNKVTVIAMHNPETHTYEQWDEIEIIRPRYFWPEKYESLQKEVGGLPIMWQKNYWIRFLAGFFLIRHTLETIKHSRRCDIIHANWTLSAIAAVLGQHYHRRPIIATVHGSDIVQATRNPLIRFLTRYALQKCHKVIAVSSALAKQVRELRVTPEKVLVIPDGVDTERFSPLFSKRGNLIIFVGSLIEIKGVHFLINSFSQLLKHFPECQLVIIGDGPLRSSLEQLTTSLELQGQITFIGSQTPEQVKDWMQRAKLLVLPSLEEGLGVVLLEALACGTPCVGTNVGGIPDVITPDVGRVVNSQDIDSLLKGIIAIMGDQNQWETMSRAARQRAVEYYSWPKIAEKISQVYREILSQSSTAGNK